jgi:hypothetical protein
MTIYLVEVSWVAQIQQDLNYVKIFLCNLKMALILTISGSKLNCKKPVMKYISLFKFIEFIKSIFKVFIKGRLYCVDYSE